MRPGRRRRARCAGGASPGAKPGPGTGSRCGTAAPDAGGAGSPPPTRALEAAIRDLLAARARTATICPSEAARRVRPGGLAGAHGARPDGGAPPRRAGRGGDRAGRAGGGPLDGEGPDPHPPRPLTRRSALLAPHVEPGAAQRVGHRVVRRGRGCTAAVGLARAAVAALPAAARCPPAAPCPCPVRRVPGRPGPCRRGPPAAALLGAALLGSRRRSRRGPPRSGFAAAPGSSSSRRVSEIRLRASSTSSTFTRTTSPDLTTSRGSD